MKFNKTVLAVAIAGIAAAPMIVSADTTLSGVVEIKLTGDDVDGSDPHIAAGDVLFNIATSHEMNNGLTAYGNLRTDLNSLSTTDAGGGISDSVYVGMKGGFGDLRFGEVNTPAEFGQVANDLHDVSGPANGGIGYTGSFGPATIGFIFSPEAPGNVGNTNQIGVGAKFAVGGFSVGVGAETVNDNMNGSVGATFAFAGASVGVAYVIKENDPGEDGSAISAKVGYAFGGVDAAFTFSQAEDWAGAETKMRLDLGYAMGGGMRLSARVNSDTDDDSTLEKSDWRIMLGKSF